MTDHNPQPPTEPGPDFQTGPQSPQPNPYAQPDPGQTSHMQAQQPPTPPQQWQAQPPYGYGIPPQPFPYAAPGPKRPGPATAAGVLGIVSGSLGLIVFLGTLTTLAGIQGRAEAGYYGDLDSLMVLLGSIQPLGILATAVALLVTGITFLKRTGYTVLFVAACAQAILTLLSLAISTIDLNLSGTMRVDPNGAMGGYLVVTLFRGLIGLSLALTTIVLLRKPEVKQWGKRTP